MRRFNKSTDIADTGTSVPNNRNLLHSLPNGFRKFHNDEGGSIVVFSLYVLMLMMIVGSIAVFIMRSEYNRTNAQYTLDRAVLAAASLKQTIPAQEVVDDYFDKANLEDIPTVVTIDQSENYREVKVDTSVTTIPHIISMFLDVDSVTSPVGATAIDGVEKVEISLVLDVSGSMRGAKLDELQVAAKEFVDSLLIDQPEPDTYSISIVPYSTQVNVGEALLSNYTVTSEHAYSHCVNFTNDDFNSVAISTGSLLQRTGHFSPWSSDYTDRPIDWRKRVCPPIAARQIIPLSGDPVVLKDYIDAFEASGNTSTDIGIKWGAALLDPEARSVVTNLIADGDIDAKFAGRPDNYNARGVLKVMVVMSDGKNTHQYYLEPEFRDGQSNVWLMLDNSGRPRYSVLDDQGTANDTSDDEWAHTNLNSTTLAHWRDYPEHDGLVATRLTYQELWAHAAIRYVAKYMEEPAGFSYNYWRYDTYHFVTPGVKDVRMDNICTAAKAKDVLMFTIGFEVTDDNAAKLESCATTPTHFFRVDGVEISEAFAAIAAQLNSLRLVR